MGEPRRRGGRGRSGRGGKIPRKGEMGAQGGGLTESFMSFPAELSAPLAVAAPVGAGAFEELLGRVLSRERRLARMLQTASGDAGDGALADVRLQVERHRDVLAQLGRDLGAELPPDDEGEPSGDPWDLVAVQRLSRLGWLSLQRAAYASGDRRIDRVVKPVVREKERHGDVVEAYALQAVGRGLFPEPEE